jgi:mono/diheme cytochrome c family protein
MRLAIMPVLALATTVALTAHDFGTNPPTWNREISRLVYDRCASCHRDGGTAFPMITYQDVQPRAVAIKEAVLSRRMPPWGAVKGFGDFRNDQGLTQEQIELVTDWVEGGMLKGNNPRVRPEPPTFKDQPTVAPPARGLVVRGELTLPRPMTVDGILPERVRDSEPMQIVAARPDGHIEPLVWLYEYREAYRHPFLFRRPLTLPAGTTIRGVPPSASVRLLPVTP